MVAECDHGTVNTNPGRKKVKFPIPTDNQEDIMFFKELIETGKYKPGINWKYPLEQIIEATRYVEIGEKTENVVISVNTTDKRAIGL